MSSFFIDQGHCTPYDTDLVKKRFFDMREHIDNRVADAEKLNRLIHDVRSGSKRRLDYHRGNPCVRNLMSTNRSGIVAYLIPMLHVN